MKIAILAGGESVEQFTKNTYAVEYDQVWGLNQQGTWQGLVLDRLFVMDDFELRLPLYAGTDFCNWLMTYPGRIITSKAYPEYPTAEEFPLKEVCQEFGVPQGIAMYSTPDYMIAMAVMEGATRIALYGVDLNNPNSLLEMQLATASWIGVAQARHVEVQTFHGSVFQYISHSPHCIERGVYGYAQRPRIEDLANRSYYK